MRVRLDAITFDAGTQIRAAIDQQVVSDYAEAMTNGAQFPAIVLFHDGNAHYLADGFHRFMAAQRNKFVDIDADVRPGTKEDALWFALGANREHAKNGLRLSRADKRHAALLAIERWPDRSAGSIAEQVGVDRSFVSNLRGEIKDRDVTTSTPAKRVGRDGKSYPANGPKRVDVERSASAERALRDGKGVSEVAATFGMSTRTVQKIREAAGIPLKLDKSRDGVRERRERMRAMAAEGYTSRQIASELGLSEQGCRDTMRAEGIDFPADRAVGKTKHHDSTRIMERIVMDAENLTEGVNLIAFDDLDRTQLAEWLKSLSASRDKLGAFIRRLMKEQQKHGEAA